MTDYFVIEPCSSANALEIKLKGKQIDLKRAVKSFETIGEVYASTSVVLLAKVKDYSISVYASGRIMVKGEKKLKQEQVKELAYEMMDALEKEHAILEGKNEN